MTKIEQLMRDSFGYGDEVNFNLIDSKHLVAVCTFPGSNAPAELVKFVPDEFLQFDYEPFTVYQGSVDNCCKVFNAIVNLP